MFDYKDIQPNPIEIGERKTSSKGYIRTPMEQFIFVPDHYGDGKNEALD